MKKLFIIAAAALVGMASCSKEGGVKPEYGKDGVGTLNITLLTDAATRATQNGSAAESVVSSLEIFIFEADGETPDEQTPYVSLTSPDFGEYGEDPDPDQSEFAPEWDGEYVTKIQVDAGTKMVLVVANAQLGGEDGEDIEGKTMEEIMAMLSTNEDHIFSTGELVTETLNTRSIPEDGFVMAGQNLAAVVEAEKTNTIEVVIYRNVSKIMAPVQNPDGVAVKLTQKELDKLLGQKVGDTGYITIDKLEGATPAIASSFQLTGYAVVSGLPKSTAGFIGTTLAKEYATDPGFTGPATFTNPWTEWNAGSFVGYNWEEQLEADPDLAPGEVLRGTRIQTNSEWMKENGKTMTDIALWEGVYSGENNMISIAGAGANTEPVVYVYESKPGMMKESAGTYEGYNADQVIAILVAGTITIDGTAYPRYWRVNVRANEAYHIVRNSVYTTTVNEIVTAGWETPWEAEEETPIINKPNDTVSDFIISIAPWDVKPVGPGQL